MRASLAAVIILLLVVVPAEAAGPKVITTFAGGNVGDGGPAASARLFYQSGLALDGSGNMYIADLLNCRLRKVSSGTITTVAGTGSCGFYGDGGPAIAASLSSPSSVAVDSAGDVYIADNCRVRKVSAGTITTFAGTGSCGYAGDGGLATAASLNGSAGLAADLSGNVYIADRGNCRIRKVSAGVITTFAGNGACLFAGDGGAPANASIAYPQGLTVAGSDLYIADSGNCRVRKVSAGAIMTIAGNGSCGFGPNGDGGAATSAILNVPQGVAVAGGNVYVAEWEGCRVRKVSGGIITTFAGNGVCGYGGDGGLATSATVDHPDGLVVDSGGNLFLSDHFNCRVREVIGATIASVVGDGTCAHGGDGGPPQGASLAFPGAVAVGSTGNVYIADNFNCRIRVVVAGTITTLAGNGTCGFGGDGGAPASTSLNRPSGVAVDTTGAVYIADTYNCRIRKVSGGVITTVAGSGACAFGGDGGPSTAASLDHPTGVAVDTGGAIYIADQGNCRVRRASGGTITTFAGSAACGYGGDGGPATSAALLGPAGLALDGAGNLYIADAQGCRVRKVSGTTISTFAGNGTCGYSGDNGAPAAASLNLPYGVAVDGSGQVYIADTFNCRIRHVSAGVVTTFAGDGTCAFRGDGGAVTLASLNDPTGIAVLGPNALVIADYENNRVRIVGPASVGGLGEAINPRGLSPLPGSGRGGLALLVAMSAALAIGGPAAAFWARSRRRRRYT